MIPQVIQELHWGTGGGHLGKNKFFSNAREILLAGKSRWYKKRVDDVANALPVKI